MHYTAYSLYYIKKSVLSFNVFALYYLYLISLNLGHIENKIFFFSKCTFINKKKIATLQQFN